MAGIATKGSRRRGRRRAGRAGLGLLVGQVTLRHRDHELDAVELVDFRGARVVADGATVRTVDIKKVQDILAGEQDVPLPRNAHTDLSYTQCCEEHEYGLYTAMAKKAREVAGIADFRQW